VSERWKKPATILDCVEGDTLVSMPSGDLMIQANIAVDEETIVRMKQGYICMNCLEPQERPFPQMCSLCRYTMRERQLLDLANKYGSLKEVHIGSRVKLADEVERMREMDAYEERTGVILPPSVKFPTETIRGD